MQSILIFTVLAPTSTLGHSQATRFSRDLNRQGTVSLTTLLNHPGWFTVLYTLYLLYAQSLEFEICISIYSTTFLLYVSTCGVTSCIMQLETKCGDTNISLMQLSFVTTPPSPVRAGIFCLNKAIPGYFPRTAMARLWSKSRSFSRLSPPPQGRVGRGYK